MPDTLRLRFVELCRDPPPLPGAGNTSVRLDRLFATGSESLSLAKLVEAHWDALAILSEAGHGAVADATYAVWASENAFAPLRMDSSDANLKLTGQKMFASGAGLVDRALVTVDAGVLVEVDLHANSGTVTFDSSTWNTDAFQQTNTSAVTFNGTPADRIVAATGWYANRAGLWHGGIGVAACWAGGAAALVEFARKSKRGDPHTLAHLGAMHAQVWGMRAALAQAAEEIDAAPTGLSAAIERSLTVRALVEQGCTEVLMRLGRAFGPFPLAIDPTMARHTRELELYIRQCHAERDLEALGHLLRTGN